MPSTLFLTWLEHTRTRHLCRRLGLPLVELVTSHRGWRRYATLTVRTVRTLLQERPRVLLVQSPSIVLALLCWLLRPVFRYYLVVDAHNEAVEPYLHPSWAMRQLTYLLLRKANLIIVTSEPLAEAVRRRGGRAAILPDSIPEAPEVEPTHLAGAFKIVLISTFAGDEPFEAVLSAMRRVNRDIHLYVTGNPAKLPQSVKEAIPSNVTLTGYLSEGDYWSTLASCDAIMDLTTMDNCLVCGAYEGVAVERPLLLSGNDASVDLFSEFAVFTDNTPDDLVRAIEALKGQHKTMLSEAPAARRRFEERWQSHADRLMELIGAQADSHHRTA